MNEMRPAKTQVTWLRARDLTPPESITHGGTVIGIAGPVADLPVLAAASVALATGAVFALVHLSLGGFFIMGLLAVVLAFVVRVRFRQASAPAVSVGAGGVWLAGTDQRAGQAIPWSAIDELVFFTVVESRIATVQATRRRVLGVRLRQPAPIPVDERELIDALAAAAPRDHARVLATMNAWQAMPYRPIGLAGRLQRGRLAAAVTGLAPSVKVVKGRRTRAYLPWNLGEPPQDRRA